MTWLKKMNAQKIVNESPSLQDLSPEDAMFAQNLMKQYGFNEKTAREIIKVRDGIDKKFPDKSQNEKDYIFLRIIGSVSYSGFRWDDTAGSLANYFFYNINSDKNTLRYEKGFNEIMEELGLSKEESKHLYGMLYLQHAVSGSKRKIGNFNEEQLNKFGIEAENVYNISGNEVKAVAKNMYRKADFTHQSITMATHISPKGFGIADFYFGRENVKDLSGWEGDTTRNATDMEPSIGTDDYLADLDSVNIVKRMSSKDQSYTQAMNSYMSDLQSYPKLREKEFKQNVDLKEVKSTIFASLVPYSIIERVRSVSNVGTIDETPSEEQLMEYLKEHYNSSYQFIRSLEKEEMQYEGGN